MGNSGFKGYVFQTENNKVPVAIVLPTDQEIVVGSIARLDGRSSLDPEGNGLTFTWSFTQVPIGSQVETFGFTKLEDDSSIVSFAPDVTGTYKVQLVVADASLTSDPTEAIIDVRVILVPHHQGYVPDASFIWNYLSDFWNLVPDKKRFETFWSGMIQVTAAEMLKLYQYQYNKSIRDIQELIQKKWISFSPSLSIDKDAVTFILSDDKAGSSASTFVIDPQTGLPTVEQPTYSNVITIPLSEGNFQTSAIGKLLSLGDRSYTLARANQTFLSVDYGVDGATSGTDVFTGSQFTADMVGGTLRILGPSTSPLLGDYLIDSYTSSTQIVIDNPPSGVTWAGQLGLTYTVIPAVSLHSSFFADQQQVPAGIENQPWRLSSTLISTEYDFEAQGVSPGDLLEIEVTRLDLEIFSTFYAQVIGVDRNRLSFALNLEDLVDGEAASGLTDDVQVTLAADLIVPGITAAVDGSLVYALSAQVVNSTINSLQFKRKYFEKVLGTDDVIDVGAFTIKARPVQIIRNKKIAIDSTIVSAPILQEYIKQPQIIKSGSSVIFVTDDGNQVASSREPYLLSENLDFIIDDESTIFGTCKVTGGVDEIIIPRGDLIDRSVQEGDTIEVAIGITTETFTIRKVLAADKIRVYPVPTDSSTASTFTIYRRVEGKFLRFIDDTFTKTRPAPARLWSEVTYFDNGEAIEGNFGVLVGVRREDLERVGSGIPYKSAVAGLMYALSTGPTISNLALSAQILLGLPFAQNAGVIKEINPAFRLREDGSPRYGRILIEGRDRNGNPTGITNIYFYPLGRQIFDVATSTWISAVPDSSGLAINPATGREYAVGDSVDQFAPLSKGVDIQEYLTDPDWFDRLVAQGDIAAVLRKYHSFQVLVNSDLITATDIDLVAQFMKKVKAHYVILTSAILKSLEDFVTIEDQLTFGRLLEFFDSSDLGTPTAVKVDHSDDNLSYLSIDGVFYTRFAMREGVSTTQGSSVVTVPDGGLLNPRVGVLENWDAPLLRAGDLISITEGPNSGDYSITSVGSDTQATVDMDGRVFQTLTNQKIIAYRPIKNPIWSGTVSVENGNDVVVPDVGIGSAGVSVGDLLVFADLGTLNPVVSRVHTVVAVDPDEVAPSITVIPDIEEADGDYDAWIVREGMTASGKIVPPGSSGENFYITGFNLSSYIEFVDTGSNINSWLNLALMRPGDQITIDNLPYTVMRWEHASRRAVISDLLSTNYTDKQVTVTLRPYRATTPVSVDFLDRLPSDYLQLEVVSSLTTGDDAQAVAGSADVTLTVETFSGLGARPGDYLVLHEGADSSTDVGHGPGVFPIKQLLGGGTIARLMDALTATGSFRYGIRRNVPNEG